jgi:hypothetical protein
LINYYAREYPELNISVTNPGMLNEYLKKNKGYDDKKDVNFKRIFEYTNGKVEYNENESCNLRERCKTVDDIINKISLELNSKRPVILRLSNDKGSAHFVLAVGKCGNRYIIADPAGGKERLYDPNSVYYVGAKSYRLRGVRIFRRVE